MEGSSLLYEERLQVGAIAHAGTNRTVLSIVTDGRC